MPPYRRTFGVCTLKYVVLKVQCTVVFTLLNFALDIFFEFSSEIGHGKSDFRSHGL